MALAWLLVSCASLGVEEKTDLKTALKQQGFAQVEQVYTPILQEDPVIANAQLGLVAFYKGDYRQATTFFQQATKAHLHLSKISVSEQAGSLLSNQLATSYIFTKTERVFVHILSAIAYFALQDVEAARVEALQLGLVLQEFEDEPDELPLPSLVFAHFFQGLIFEVNGENDQALVSYRKANQAAGGETAILQQAMLRQMLLLGLDYNPKNYSSKTLQQAKLGAGAKAQVLEFSLSGFVDSMQALRHYDSLSKAYVEIGHYPDQNNTQPELHFSSPSFSKMQTLVGLDSLVKSQARIDFPAKLAKTVARVVAKKVATKAASSLTSDKDTAALVSLLGNVYSAVSEEADLRAWDFLPRRLGVSRQFVFQENLKQVQKDFPELKKLPSKFTNLIRVRSQY